MTGELEYEPIGFRNLSAVPDPEDVRQFESRLDAKRRQINELDPVIAMFGARGWEHVRHELERELQRFVNALANPKLVNSASMLAYIQGQMNAIQFVLGMPTQAQIRRDVLKKELQNLQESS